MTAVVVGSWLPLFYLYTHVSNDPFEWRSWLLVFQVMALLPVFFLIPTENRRWKEKFGKLLLYWSDTGEPVPVRKPIDVLRSPVFWMGISFTFDLAFWVWAATLIDPLVVTIIFQLMLIGMVWMAARLGRKLSAGLGTSPHVIGTKHWVLMGFSFLGAALVIWSETGAIGTLNWLGIALAFGGTVTACGSLWGTVSTGRLLGWPGGNPHDLVWNATFAAVAGRILALPLTLLGSIIFFPSSGDNFEFTWSHYRFFWSLPGSSTRSGP